MKKILIASALSVSMVTSAVAGSAIYVAPAEPVVEESERMGSSFPWWIPVLIIGGIVFLTHDNCEGSERPGCEPL